MPPQNANGSEAEAKSPAAVFSWRHFACLADEKAEPFWWKIISVIREIRGQSAMIAIRVVSKSFNQLIVSLVPADPVPNKELALERAYGTVVQTDPHRPFPAADLFEVQRRMERFSA